MTLENKRYLITGASSGLGYALLKRLLRIKGIQITAAARNIKSIKKLAKHQVFPISCDCSRPQNVDALLDYAIRKMGGIDCVIACAGFGYFERFDSKDFGHIERIFQTNVFSPLYTLQRLLEKTKGKISFVVISSALGKFGIPGMSLYCATKYALDGFQDAYRFERPDRLHYMTVYPIGLETGFWERISTNIPLPRPLQTADAAAKAVLCGLRNDRRMVRTSLPAVLMWEINRFLPVLVPAYQIWNKIRYEKWLNGRYGNRHYHTKRS